MKRLLALVLSIIMFMTCLMTVFAVPVDTEVEYAQKLISLYLGTNETTVDLSSVILLNEIPTYEYQDGFFERIPDLQYFPAVSGGKVFGIFTIATAPDGSHTYSFGKDFADEINAFGKPEYCIIFDGPSLYLKSDTDALLVSEQLGYAVSDQAVAFTFVDKSQDFARMKDTSITFLQTSESDKLVVSVQIPRAQHIISNITTWNQNAQTNTTNLCWAGTMYIVGRKMNGSGNTPVSIAIEVHGSREPAIYNQGVMYYDIAGYYSDVYNDVSATLFYYDLDMSEVQDYVDAGIPMHSHWESPSYRHSLTVFGWADNGTLGVSDTYGGSKKWLATDGYEWVYKYGSIDYYWFATTIPD